MSQGGPPTIVYKWGYSPRKWPYTWVTGVVNPISGVITLLKTGSMKTSFKETNSKSKMKFSSPDWPSS